MNFLVSDPFQNLLKIADVYSPLPTSSNTVKSLLVTEASNVRERLTVEFQKVKGALTAAIDLWTDPAMLNSYIGITLHFVCGSKLVYRCIGIKQIIGSHTGENIKKHVKEKLAEFGLNLNDIFAIVTDNGANIIRAFQQYQGKDIL